MSAYGSNVTFGYRSDNLRAWKQVGSTRTYYLYDGGNAVLEMNSSGTVTAVNAFGPDGLVARQSGSAWTYYTFDQQGNVAVRQSSDGTITSRSTFDAYGVEFSTGSPSDPYAYNGQWGYYYDREIGLYYCQNRFYDPSQGRWLNRDPIGYEGGANLYGYCGGSPVGWADSDGLQSASTPPGHAAIIRELIDDAARAGGRAIGQALQVGRTLVKHHAYPRQFADKFRRAGIDIDKNLIKIPEFYHKHLHRGLCRNTWEWLTGQPGRGGWWNNKWAEFFRRNPNAKAADMKKFLKELMEEAYIEDLPLVAK